MGEPLQSVYDAVIDADPKAPGVQEVKEWMALVWYLQQQPDTNGNGIPDIPLYYRTGNPEASQRRFQKLQNSDTHMINT